MYLVVEGDQETYGLKDLAGKVTIIMYACCVLVCSSAVYWLCIIYMYILPYKMQCTCTSVNVVVVDCKCPSLLEECQYLSSACGGRSAPQ